MAQNLSAPAQSSGASRPETPDSSATLHLPRVLCLHGGGVNASIFRAQMRAFLTHPQLSTRFRFVFVEAPFFCDEGLLLLQRTYHSTEGEKGYLRRRTKRG